MTGSPNNNEMFDKLFRYAKCANALLDINGKFIMVNETYCKLMGYTEEELIGKETNLVIPEERADLEKEKMEGLFGQHLSNLVYESKRLTKDGIVLKVDVNAIAINGETPGQHFVIKQMNRVTEESSLKEEIRQKQFLLDTIMTEMPMNIYFKDLKSRFILSSRAQARRFNVKDPKDIIGKTDFDFFAKEHAQKAYDDEQKIIQTGEGLVAEEKLTWPDGSITWSSSTKQALKDSNGNIQGTFGISKDITENVRNEQRIKEANEQLERKNKELEITLNSLKEMQAQLVSSEKMAALGQLIAGIAHEINTPLGAINASNSNIADSLKKIYRILPRLCSEFNPTELGFINFLLENADFGANHLSSRDKRALKREISEKLIYGGIPQPESVAENILYMNVHEYVDLILPQLKHIDADKCLETGKLLISLNKNSNNIMLATDKASNVVLALKKFIHRTADGSKSLTDLKENLETVLTLNQNKLKQGIELVKKYDEIPAIESYPDELSQVWNNIITNAIQAMEGKGTLTLELFSKDPKQVTVRISDTGCGIPEEIREKIFIPFFTTKVSGQGTGIGLDVVKRILDKHNAVLTLESEVNKGSTFTIDMPVN